MEFYSWFYFLAHATRFIARLSKSHSGLRVWAFEMPHEGRKKWLVATKEVFWRRYNGPLAHLKYFYEVIPEQCRCRLFFDIDVIKEANPNFRFCSAMNVFLTIVINIVQESLGIAITLSDILLLDASTEQKYSQHVIVNGFVFPNILECRQFVNYLAAKVRRGLLGKAEDRIFNNDSYSIEELRMLEVQSSGGTSLLFDLKVYCRNQQFRLLGSKKRGRNNPLVLAGENSTTIFNDDSLFDDSLISYDVTAPMISLTRGLVAAGTSSLARSNVTPASPQVLNRTLTETVTYFCDRVVTVWTVMPEVGKKLAEFVVSQARSRIAAADLGKITRCGVAMKFDINGSRWCSNINREHKSNRIYFVVDLVKYKLFQRCYDIECNGSRATPIQLPSNLHFICDTMKG